MFKEIVGITKNYLDERIEQLEKDLKTLKSKVGNVDTSVQAFEWVIAELNKVRNTMLNACDYGKWLKEQEEED